jgi:hypothetical protein
MHVSLTRYAIQAGKSCYPQSWILEGSSDQANWTTLDEQAPNTFLNGTNFCSSFAILNPREVRFIRFRATGQSIQSSIESSSQPYDIIIARMEFFGKLRLS